MPPHNKADHALKVSATCFFCGGSIEQSELLDRLYCTNCGIQFPEDHITDEQFQAPPLIRLQTNYEEQELHCALCKLPIGKIYAKQKPPEMPSPMPTGALYDYADPNVQKMLAFRYKEHKGNCAVRMNF